MHGGAIPGIMSAFSDVARANELEAYVKKNISPDAGSRAEETAEGIRFKAALKQRELPVVDDWVKRQSGPNPRSADL